MTPERWLEIEELYYAALEQGSDRRASFIADACGSDENLREQLAGLLAQSGSTRELGDLDVLWESLADAAERSKLTNFAGRGWLGT